MRFSMPHYPCEFEIPDDWLAAAGCAAFTPTTAAYRSNASAALIPLTEIEPPPRYVSTPKDWRGFDQTRLIRVLKGFVAGDQIDPVPLIALPIPELGHTPYRYRVLHGVHRFYSSIAVGFSHLPAEI